MELPNARLEFTNAHLELPNAHLEFTNAHLELPNARLEFTNARLELPNARLEFTNARLELPNARLEMPNAPMALPHTHLEAFSPTRAGTAMACHYAMTSRAVSDSARFPAFPGWAGAWPKTGQGHGRSPSRPPACTPFKMNRPRPSRLPALSARHGNRPWRPSTRKIHFVIILRC
jgi:hypothetical protein